MLVSYRLAEFTTASCVDWRRDRWWVGSIPAFRRRVRRLFLLLLLLWLRLLLLSLPVFGMCNFRDCNLITELVEGVNSGAGGHHWSNFVLERVVEAFPSIIIENFFILLLIPPSGTLISFQTIRIGSDRFLWKLYIYWLPRVHCHVSSVLIPIILGHVVSKKVEVL